LVDIRGVEPLKIAPRRIQLGGCGGSSTPPTTPAATFGSIDCRVCADETGVPF
jgi:hypothetical protein